MPRGPVDAEVARRRREAREERERQAKQEGETVREFERQRSVTGGRVLGLAGAVFFALGMYYLLNPAVADSDTINLQRLTMDETFTIVGAILSGFAWRPKA
jgi:hypothetical protein